MSEPTIAEVEALRHWALGDNWNAACAITDVAKAIADDWLAAHRSTPATPNTGALDLPRDEVRSIEGASAGTLAEDCVSRITEYLSAGGLFNPELMDHQKVSMLLRDCRARIEALSAEVAEAVGAASHEFDRAEQAEARAEAVEKALRAAHADLVQAVREGRWNTVADAVEGIRAALAGREGK